MYLIWKKLEEAFPGWEIHHTGGGIFVIRRDFADLTGQSVMVSVNEDAALIMRDVDDNRFITHEQFLEDEGTYWEMAFDLEVVIMEADNDKIEGVDVAREVFPHATLQEIADAMNMVGKIIWGSNMG